MLFVNFNMKKIVLFQTIMAALVCFLTACSERNFETEKVQQPIQIHLDENLALLDTAYSLSLYETPVKGVNQAENITPLIKKMNLILATDKFEKLVNSAKDIEKSTLPSTFNIKFKKDLKKYHRVWQKNLDALRQKQKELHKFCDAKVTRDYIDRIRALYGAKGRASEKYDVYLVPEVNGFEPYSSFTKNGTILLPILKTGISENTRSMLHEALSIIRYDASNEIGYSFNEVCDEDNDQINDARFVLIFTDLAVETAIFDVISQDKFGTAENMARNGFVYQYAKALAPMVKKYMDSKKLIDREFYEEAIKIFKETFPDYKSNANYRLWGMGFFFSDNADDTGKPTKHQNRTINNILYGNLDHTVTPHVFQLTANDGKNYTLDHTRDSELWSDIILLKNDEDFEGLNRV